MPDLKAKGDSHDMKSEQPNKNADSEKVDQKAFCKDEEIFQEKECLLPEEKKISRNKPCPCVLEKKYKGGGSEKKSLLPEKKFIVNDLKPGTSSGHTLIVKVVSSSSVINKGRTSAGSLSTRPRPRIAECLVGDKTGTIIFTARNEQVDLMKTGSTVFLRNAKINMFKGSMRLAVDKCGHVDVTEPANFAVNEDNNLSLDEYVLVDAEQ